MFIPASTISAHGGYSPQMPLNARIAASNSGSKEMTCRGLGVLTVSGRVASHAMTAVTIPATDPSCVRGSKPAISETKA